MSTFEIEGGRPLNGTVRAAGNKNAVLPMITAALLTEETIVLENVPGIGDVQVMLELAEVMGVRTERDIEKGTLALTATRLDSHSLMPHLCSEVRAGILFAAPLLHRAGAAEMVPPGGDVIGRRRLDSHFYGLDRMGVVIEYGPSFRFHAADGLHGADIFLPEASVTATAQMLLAAVRAKGITIIRNAACEPHIEDLGVLLQKMGAVIEGLGTNTVTIHGVEKLHGARHSVVSDHTEAGSFLALAAATGGEVTVEGVEPSHYRMIQRTFNRLGIELEFHDQAATVRSEQKRCVKPDYGSGIPVIDDGTWPQFPSDLMSVMIVLATQVNGTALFFEKMYESRMYFVDRLVAMGANAVICDPHRAVISGPAQLHAIDLSSPDIRAGMALVGAALCASGRSTIRNVQLIDRGYEHIDAKLQALGACINRISP